MQFFLFITAFAHLIGADNHIPGVPMIPSDHVTGWLVGITQVHSGWHKNGYRLKATQILVIPGKLTKILRKPPILSLVPP